MLLELIEPTGLNKWIFARLYDDLEQYASISRILNLESGAISVADEGREEEIVVQRNRMNDSLSPMYRLLRLGAGDVAKFVAELATGLEYDAKLCDPRANYLDN